MSVGIQGALAEAQLENIKAQTNKTNAEASAVGGYQKDKAVAETRSLSQGVENAKAQEILTKTQNRLTEVTADVAWGSMEDAINKINYEANKAYHDLRIAKNEADMSDDTYNDKVEMVKAELAGALVKNGLMKAQTGLTEEQIEKTSNEIEVMWENLSLSQDKLLQEKDRVLIDAKLREAGLDIQERKLIIDALGKFIPQGGGFKGGFKRTQTKR